MPPQRKWDQTTVDTVLSLRKRGWVMRRIAAELRVTLWQVQTICARYEDDAA